MQIFVKTFKIKFTLQKMTTPGGILAKEDHKTLGRSLAGDDSRRHGKTLARALSRPLPRTAVGPPSGPRQPNLHRRLHAAVDPTS